MPPMHKTLTEELRQNIIALLTKEDLWFNEIYRRLEKKLGKQISPNFLIKIFKELEKDKIVSFRRVGVSKVYHLGGVN